MTVHQGAARAPLFSERKKKEKKNTKEQSDGGTGGRAGGEERGKPPGRRTHGACVFQANGGGNRSLLCYLRRYSSICRRPMCAQRRGWIFARAAAIEFRPCTALQTDTVLYGTPMRSRRRDIMGTVLHRGPATIDRDRTVPDGNYRTVIRVASHLAPSPSVASFTTRSAPRSASGASRRPP